MGLYSKPCASPPSRISFHQTIFLITQQKQRQPDFKQHQAAIREPDITLQAGKGHFVNKRERQHIKARTPPTFPLCSDATDDFRSSSMTLPICWVLLSGASSQQQIRNVQYSCCEREKGFDQRTPVAHLNAGCQQSNQSSSLWYVGNDNSSSGFSSCFGASDVAGRYPSNRL